MTVTERINKKLNVLIDVVKSTQWVDGECPVCSGTQRGGHLKSCTIGIAIKEFEEE